MKKPVQVAVIEGGWNEGGRTESVWDVWTHTPGKTYQGTTGDVACDHYHRWPQDIQLMKDLGLKHYRLSLSWNRIIPGGFKGSPVNPEGIKFYKQLLTGLLAEGIQPMVTLFHWDLPQVLQDEYGGFRSNHIVEDYVYYAEVVFRELGRFVQQWITFNEPQIICDLGFKAGLFPPGEQGGNEAMFTCGHNLLLAHAAAVKLFRDKFQPSQHGRVTVAVCGAFGIPYDSQSQADAEAVEIMMQSKWAWFAEPLLRGDYPPLLRKHYEMLPSFTAEEQMLLQGSIDFLAVNVYTSRYVQPGFENENPWAERYTNGSGHSIGPDTDLDWHKVSPVALRGSLAWLTNRYGPIELVVTENGVPVPGESDLPVEKAVQDTFRLDFYRDYINGLCQAVSEDGANVTGYYAWSFMDNLEWLEGFKPRFGIVYVDFEGDLARTPKHSSLWLSQHFFKAGS
eukprot:gene11794-11939_t